MYVEFVVRQLLIIYPQYYDSWASACVCSKCGSLWPSDCRTAEIIIPSLCIATYSTICDWKHLQINFQFISTQPN